ncbi:MAG: transporter [Chitinophagales bacterium]|nr:transporter [Chitinophagales bacterium]
MKKLLLFVCVVCITLHAYACNTCGCASYSSFMGLSNYAFTNYIGLSWNYFSFTEQDDQANSGANSSIYHKFEMRGAYTINKKWQVTGTLPYAVNQYLSSSHNDAEGIKENFTGLGDMSITGNYMLYSNSDSVMKKINHFVVGMAGVELPTGKFNQTFRVDHIPAALSPGSGSVDIFAGLQYTVTTNKWNFRTAYQYKLNTENTDAYNFGDQHHVEIFGARKVSLKNFMLLPYCGASYDKITKDYYHQYEQAGTGTEAVSINAGAECSFRKINFGAYVALPVESRLGDVEIQKEMRMQVYTSLML